MNDDWASIVAMGRGQIITVDGTIMVSTNNSWSSLPGDVKMVHTGKRGHLIARPMVSDGGYVLHE